MLWHAISPVLDTGGRSRLLVGSRRMNSDAKIILLYVEGLPDEERLGMMGPLWDYARAAGIDSGPFTKAKRFLRREGHLNEWSYTYGNGRWATAQILSNAPITLAEAKAVWAVRGCLPAGRDDGWGERWDAPDERTGGAPGGESGGGRGWRRARGPAPSEGASPQVSPSDADPAAGRTYRREQGGYPPDGQVMARSSHLPTCVVEDSKAERGWPESRFEGGFEGGFEWGPPLEDESDTGFWSEPPEWMVEQDPAGVAPQKAPMASEGPVGPVGPIAPAESSDREAARETAPEPEPGPVAPDVSESAAESAPGAAAVLDPESGPQPERVRVTVPPGAPGPAPGTTAAADPADTADPADARGKGWTIHMVRAEEVLLSLGKESRQLHLGVYEARRLVDKAAEWLRRGMAASEMRYVLSSALPQDGVKSAVGFLGYRLKEKMPPEPGRRRDVSPGASRPQGVDGPPDRDQDPAPEVVPPPPLLVCEGPGDEHMFRAYQGHTKCGHCQQIEAYERWSAQREAAALARGEDGLTGDGKGGWRDRLAELAASRGGPDTEAQGQPAEGSGA